MVDLEGNVGETISRYHDHFERNWAINKCGVRDVWLTSSRSLTVGAGHVRGEVGACGRLWEGEPSVDLLTRSNAWRMRRLDNHCSCVADVISCL